MRVVKLSVICCIVIVIPYSSSDQWSECPANDINGCLCYDGGIQCIFYTGKDIPIFRKSDTIYSVVSNY